MDDYDEVDSEFEAKLDEFVAGNDEALQRLEDEPPTRGTGERIVRAEIVVKDWELLDRLAAGSGDRIRVDFDTVQRRSDGYHVMTALKFAAVERNVIAGNEAIATDDAGATARAVVASVSDEGLVDLLLVEWQPRGTGWCAPSS